MKKPIRIGTRGSKLALWQANHVAARLEQAGLPTEIVIITTRGDVVLDRSLDKIGAKGVFTEELEESLRTGHITIAVHSAKDVQSSIPADLELLAFMEREQVNDVIVSFNADLDLQRPDLVLGTSSTRRKAMLKRFLPHATTAEARGNLQTRLRKLEEGQYHALVLAYAGVHRMEYDGLIRYILPETQYIPATGQGSVAIESTRDLEPSLKAELKRILDHPDTHLALVAERAFLRTMEGGCSIPSFALATLTSEGHVHLHGGLISLDGQQFIDVKQTAPADDAEALGIRIAETVLARGGQQILHDIRQVRNAENVA
ncbi:hydroxymethylbilane synthase [Hymenobacter taeanensis]|uniref:Hydroxymethylbilane synthase n=1 Tax=Hymenobacter taeanensis TaxID=2735321 RepID=A0A6M6BDH3_9BACT|nr:MULTISPECIES: hydroxymethylbilane synthase [Hymenobacter]QJX46000.1 hydroxymethylbilane synthase [Hymenobacter taeanensis]UOQ79852.1 hydroxymethylbilane synthase [Hymenobacter sp. 5414T-23]